MYQIRQGSRNEEEGEVESVTTLRASSEQKHLSSERRIDQGGKPRMGVGKSGPA